MIKRLMDFFLWLCCCRSAEENDEEIKFNDNLLLSGTKEEISNAEVLAKFAELKKEILIIINEKSEKKLIGRPLVKDLEEVKTEIAEILNFIRMNSLITVFQFEMWDKGGALTNLLNFAEENFGSDQMEVWLNVYETENPLLAMLKRPNLKNITLAHFLREIRIWERNGGGYPVKRNLSGTVKIRKNDDAKQPMIELENGTSKVTLCTTPDLPDKVIQVPDGIPESLWNILNTLGKTEFVVEMCQIVGIGGEATVLGKELDFEREHGKENIKTCLKFEKYKNEEREEMEKRKELKINGVDVENGPVFGKGLIRHLMNSMEYQVGSRVTTHPNVIKILDFGITKTIFGDYFLCLG